MTPHFSLEEFTQSDTAARLGIDNRLPDELRENALKTLEMMERIRFHIDAPITITSGYRCEALNRAVGSKPGSDHTLALACDFKAPKAGTPFKIATMLAPVIKIIGIGQLILEYASPNGSGWVHVSTRIPDKIINRIITINKDGARAGIWQ
jgi:zinc D-Ala-D-Ala carboxypeptidase